MLGPPFYKNIITHYMDMVINFKLCCGRKTRTQKTTKKCFSLPATSEKTLWVKPTVDICGCFSPPPPCRPQALTPSLSVISKIIRAYNSVKKKKLQEALNHLFHFMNQSQFSPYISQEKRNSSPSFTHSLRDLNFSEDVENTGSIPTLAHVVRVLSWLKW